MEDDDGVWAAIKVLLTPETLALQPGVGTIFDVRSLFNDSWDDIPVLELVSASEESDADSLPDLLTDSDDKDDGSELDGFFDSDSECSNFPDLKSVSDSEDKVDDDDDSNVDEEEACAMGPLTGLDFSIHVELYYSGCSQYLTPFRDQFEMYQEIPPKTFKAANKQTFSAVGQGDVLVEVPNRDGSSELWLTEVLYSPEIGYTLVSVGCLDQARYTLSFGRGQC